MSDPVTTLQAELKATRAAMRRHFVTPGDAPHPQRFVRGCPACEGYARTRRALEAEIARLRRAEGTR